jgi:drug/metabolite transporter (DMT)-like permease
VLLGVTASWGLTFAAIKDAVSAIDADLFMALRFWFTLAILLIIFRRHFFAGWRGRIGQGILLGGLLFLSYSFQANGLETTSATRSAFITGVSVVLVPMFYIPMRRRHPGPGPLAGAVLSVAGLFFLTRPDMGRLAPGDILTLGCATAYAMYVVYLEVFTENQSAEPLIGLQTAVMCVATLLPAAGSLSDPPTWGSHLWIGLAVTVPVTVFTLIGMTRFQARTTATRASVIYSAEPVFAFFFSALWLGERLDASGLAGAGLIMAGVLVAVLI